MDYFCDTTIIYEKIFSSQGKEEIQIPKGCLITSTYVLKEYLTILVAGRYLHTALDQSDDISELMNNLSRMYSSNRINKKIFKIFGKLFEIEKTTDIKKQKAILEMLIDEGFMLMFLNEFDKNDLLDNTKCPFSEFKLKKIPGTNIYENTRISCNKKDEICDLEDFLKVNLKEMGKIYENLKEDTNTKKKHKKEFEVIERTLKDLKNAKGISCPKIGDVIIALESPDDHTLLSTDHFFDFLGKSLSKEINILKSSNN